MRAWDQASGNSPLVEQVFYRQKIQGSILGISGSTELCLKPVE